MKKCKICKLPYTGLGTKHIFCSLYVEGFVEVDENKNPVIGRIGLRVYRFKKDILAEGFEKESVAKVRVVII